MERKISHKSFRFSARTVWSAARRGVLSAPGKPDVVVGSPPEFKGEASNWAPEELLVAALNTCTMLTFITLAQARGVTFFRYESDAEGLLENVEGKFQITAITVRPRVAVKGDGDLDPARQAMNHAEAQCFIANSIKAKITLVPEFTVASATE